ncbi:MAG: hypothetical protein ACRCZ6_16615 [Kluyvera sp.]
MEKTDNLVFVLSKSEKSGLPPGDNNGDRVMIPRAFGIASVSA